MPSRRLAASLLATGVVLLPLWAAERAAHAGGFERGEPNARQNAVLCGVLSETRRLTRAGIRPVNIFDLDATIFDAGGRHKQIMAEYLRTRKERFPGALAKVLAWKTDELPYEIDAMFEDLGIRSSEDRKEAKHFWVKRFFSNDYLHHDLPIAGAIAYLKALERAGSVIVYLTGRNDAQLRSGSTRVLEQVGFPMAPGTGVLLMNPTKGLRDSAFKGGEEVRGRIQALGTVVGIFDNEPGNVNELQKSFPDAMTVFLDTNHSPGAPPVDRGIPWIKNFRWAWIDGARARSSR